MRAIKIKCRADFFQAVKEGRKRSEVRFDDRMYQEGDILCLVELDATGTQPTGRTEWRRITHVLHDWDIPEDICGLKKGYVVLSIGEPVPSQFPHDVAARMDAA